MLGEKTVERRCQKPAVLQTTEEEEEEQEEEEQEEQEQEQEETFKLSG